LNALSKRQGLYVPLHSDNSISKNGSVFVLFIYYLEINCIMQTDRIQPVESNFQFANDQIHVAMQDKNFLVQMCSLCNKEMTLGEGATIYGEKWYHKDCWQSITKGEECKR